MKRKFLLGSLLVMAIGFAAVTTTLYINGTANVVKNADDFKVYYSDVKVNGERDLTIVDSATKLVFKTVLDEIGEKYVLDYDVTNGSKNYDADLEMVCTGGNEYLRVTNSFNDSDVLESLDTRSGKLTLEMIKSNTGNDLDVTIECFITN